MSSEAPVFDAGEAAAVKSAPRTREPGYLYSVARSMRGDANRATQQRIKDALHRMLEREKLSEISVLGIAHEAGISPATFYRYYRDAEHVAQAMSLDLIHDLDEAAEFAELDWSGEAGEQIALAFVQQFFAHWTRNKPILRMRNLKAEEGDQFFADVRVHTLRRSTTALVHKMRGPGVPAGDPRPSVVGNLLLGMLERAGAYQDMYRGGHEVAARVAASLVYEAVASRSPAR
jgi:AcrR family transcriptional regulator